MKYFFTLQSRGFTLLVTMILVSVILSVSLSLLDLSYKQVYLTSIEAQSQVAFYNADSGLECALFQDEKQDMFDYTSELTSGSFACEGQSNITYVATPPSGALPRTTVFTIPCAGDTTSGDGSATVTVYKQSTGSTNIYSNGFNTCHASDTRRVERGITASY
jgi:Tfp pilus assembly protein PilE